MKPHMHVDAADKAKVAAVLAECKQLAEAHYGKPCPTITVRYDINSSRLAGMAKPVTAILRLNPAYLKHCGESYFDRTVRHEFAHIYCYVLHGRLVKASGKTRVKRDIHGPKWVEVMHVVGAKDVTRTHNYKLPSEVAAVVGKPKYEYKCKSCSYTFDMGPKRHARAQREIAAGKQTYYHGKCGRVGGQLVYIAPAHTNVSAAAPVKLKAPTMGSKIDQCYAWYKGWFGSSGYETRADMINVFVQEVGCTPAGASTYFNTCKKMSEAGI